MIFPKVKNTGNDLKKRELQGVKKLEIFGKRRSQYSKLTFVANIFVGFNSPGLSVFLSLVDHFHFSSLQIRNYHPNQ